MIEKCLDSDDSDASDYEQVETFDCPKCRKPFMFQSAMEDHREECVVDVTQYQIVPFEPIVKDERKKEPPAVKRKRLDDALAILTESPEPPYRCPDCMNESYTPIDYLTHLGEDHFVHAEEEDNSFAPNKREYYIVWVFHHSIEEAINAASVDLGDSSLFMGVTCKLHCRTLECGTNCWYPNKFLPRFRSFFIG